MTYNITPIARLVGSKKSTGGVANYIFQIDVGQFGEGLLERFIFSNDYKN